MKTIRTFRKTNEVTVNVTHGDGYWEEYYISAGWVSWYDSESHESSYRVEEAFLPEEVKKAIES